MQRLLVDANRVSMSAPLIGITIDEESRILRGVATQHGVQQQYYADAVLAAGGLPLFLPNLAPAQAVHYLSRLHGIVFAGGDFDIDPSLYGAPPHPALGTLKPERTRFELALLRAAEARSLPLLGVCGGMQLMNVARGGTLVQDLPSERPSQIAHSQAGDKRTPGHTVSVSGKLAELLGSGPLEVNSTHHQAVKTLGKNLRAEAIAEDEVIEGLVDASTNFYVGVQWHPEAMTDQNRHAMLYRALVQAASAFASADI